MNSVTIPMLSAIVDKLNCKLVVVLPGFICQKEHVSLAIQNH